MPHVDANAVISDGQEVRSLDIPRCKRARAHKGKLHRFFSACHFGRGLRCLSRKLARLALTVKIDLIKVVHYHHVCSRASSKTSAYKDRLQDMSTKEVEMRRGECIYPCHIRDSRLLTPWCRSSQYADTVANRTVNANRVRVCIRTEQETAAQSTDAV